MGKKTGISVAERAKIVTSNEEKYSERQSIRQLSDFEILGVFSICTGLEDPWLPTKRMIT